MTASEFFKRYIFVRKCISCKEILGFEEMEEAFCDKCKVKWSVSKAQTCPSCYRSSFECTCMPKKLSKAGVPCLVKLGFYNKDKFNEPQNKIIYFLKHNKNKRATEFIARELVPSIKREAETLGLDCVSDDAIVTWIPRSRSAKAREGHDQSELVCRAISKMLGSRLCELLLRKRGAKEQKKLGFAARGKNTKNSFEFNGKLGADKGKAIILFDDIVTTGSSMAEAVTVLRKNGFKTIICVTIAAVL